MDKSSAIALIQMIIELDDRLINIEDQLRNISDDNEKKNLLIVLGKIIAEIDAGLLRPVVRQYPDLNPDP